MFFFKRSHKSDDLLEDFLAQDEQVQAQIRRGYQTYRAKVMEIQENQNLFMSLKQIHKSWQFFASNHVVASFLIFVMAFTTIGAISAEALAPEAYKPSTTIQRLFNPAQNRQSETDASDTLSPDEANDTVSFEECGLIIKYPKQAGGSSINSFRNDSQVDQMNNLILASDEFMDTLEADLHPVSVNCSQEPGLAPEIDTAKSLTREELASFTGWFLAEAEIENIVDYYNEFTASHLVTFNYNDLTYYIGFTEKIEVSEELEQYDGLFGNDVQMQFASQVEVETNVDSIEALRPGQNSFQEPEDTTEPSELPEFIARNGYQIAHLPSCGLTFQYLSSGPGALTPRYETLLDGTLDRQTVLLIAQPELQDGSLIPTSVLTCNPDKIITEGLAETGLEPLSVVARNSVDEVASQENAEYNDTYGITLNLTETQFLDNQVTTIETTEGLQVQYLQRQILEDTTVIDYSYYPFSFTTRPPSPVLISFETEDSQKGQVDLLEVSIPEDVIEVKPVNSASLEFEVFSNSDGCSMRGVQSYTTGTPGSNEFANMNILNTVITRTDRQINSVRQAQSFLQGGEYSLEVTEAFRNYCSGYYSEFVGEFEASYPGTDSVKAFVTLDGQGLIPDPMIKVIARKGNDIILLEKQLTNVNGQEFYWGDYLANSCPMLAEGLDFEACFVPSLISAPSFNEIVREDLNYLTNEFALVESAYDENVVIPQIR
jgi:hypothetical protein